MAMTKMMMTMTNPLTITILLATLISNHNFCIKTQHHVGIHTHTMMMPPTMMITQTITHHLHTLECFQNTLQLLGHSIEWLTTVLTSINNIHPKWDSTVARLSVTTNDHTNNHPQPATNPHSPFFPHPAAHNATPATAKVAQLPQKQVPKPPFHHQPLSNTQCKPHTSSQFMAVIILQMANNNYRLP